MLSTANSYFALKLALAVNSDTNPAKSLLAEAAIVSPSKPNVVPALLTLTVYTPFTDVSFPFNTFKELFEIDLI